MTRRALFGTLLAAVAGLGRKNHSGICDWANGESYSGEWCEASGTVSAYSLHEFTANEGRDRVALPPVSGGDVPPLAHQDFRMPVKPKRAGEWYEWEDIESREFYLIKNGEIEMGPITFSKRAHNG